MSSASTPTILMKLYQGLCWLTYRGIPECGGADSSWRGGSRHGFSGGIARGLFGCRASGVGPAVEERQPEPTAVVAGGDPATGWIVAKRPGSAAWTARRCADWVHRFNGVGSGGPRRQLDGGSQASSFGGATGSVRADRRGRPGSREGRGRRAGVGSTSSTSSPRGSASRFTSAMSESF